ncbi:MAG: tyrosine-type recombinase/integrase, partial [Candidatus Pacebacteria bacterium]|nr:tyrosine-type recombinase/integrase [Candidatus Paceibacterota bacterium]
TEQRKTSSITLPVPTGESALTSPGKGDIRELIQDWLRSRGSRTRMAYLGDLKDFAKFLGLEKPEDAIRGLFQNEPGRANELALKYRNNLKERGLKSNTINRRISAIRSIIKLARILGRISWSLEIGGEKRELCRDTSGPGRDGFKQILEKIKARKDKKGIRDYAILRLLHDLGLRRGEIVSLDLEHVDLAGGKILILGKGRSGRIPLTLPEPTKKTLEDWISARGSDPGPLFTSLDRAKNGNGRITGEAIYYMVRESGTKVGIKTRPHGIRHLAVTLALDITQGNLRAVQRFSRHKDLRILNAYDDNRQDLGGEVARKVAETAQ